MLEIFLADEAPDAALNFGYFLASDRFIDNNMSRQDVMLAVERPHVSMVNTFHMRQ
jgi:hypothetical protein